LPDMCCPSLCTSCSGIHRAWLQRAVDTMCTYVSTCHCAMCTYVSTCHCAMCMCVRMPLHHVRMCPHATKPRDSSHARLPGSMRLCSCSQVRACACKQGHTNAFTHMQAHTCHRSWHTRSNTPAELLYADVPALSPFLLCPSHLLHATALERVPAHQQQVRQHAHRPHIDRGAAWEATCIRPALRARALPALPITEAQGAVQAAATTSNLLTEPLHLGTAGAAPKTPPPAAPVGAAPAQAAAALLLAHAGTRSSSSGAGGAGIHTWRTFWPWAKHPLLPLPSPYRLPLPAAVWACLGCGAAADAATATAATAAPPPPGASSCVVGNTISRPVIQVWQDGRAAGPRHGYGVRTMAFTHHQRAQVKGPTHGFCGA